MLMPYKLSRYLFGTYSQPYNLTNTFIIILINNTILHRFSIKTAAVELAPSEANHMAGRWLLGHPQTHDEYWVAPKKGGER